MQILTMRYCVGAETGKNRKSDYIHGGIDLKDEN